MCAFALIVALGSTAHAYDIYDNGTISSTYVTYFRDILAGSKFNDNYVAFRSGQYEYIMLVGKLEKSGNTISLVEEGKEYKFYTDSGTQYNSTYRYSVKDVSTGSVDVGNNIIYSDLGDYPELIERGDKYEALTLFVLVVVLCAVVINRIFFTRKR